jgi:hypothetical protein
MAITLLSNTCLLSPKVLSNLINARKDYENRRTSALGEQRTGLLLSCVSQALSTAGMQVRARGVLNLIETLHGCISHGHKAQIDSKNAFTHSSSAGLLLNTSAGNPYVLSGPRLIATSGGMPFSGAGITFSSGGAGNSVSEPAKRSWCDAIEDDIDEIEMREMMEEDSLTLREDDPTASLRNRSNHDLDSVERRRMDIEMRLERIRHAKMARVQVGFIIECVLMDVCVCMCVCVYIYIYIYIYIHTVSSAYAHTTSC